MRIQHSNEIRESAEIPEAVSRFACLPNEALIAAQTMQELFDVRGNATLWRMERAGRLPKSRRLPGSQHRRWVVGEVRAFLKAIAVFGGATMLLREKEALSRAGLGAEDTADEWNVKADDAVLGDKIPSHSQCQFVAFAINRIPSDLKHDAESALLSMLIAFLKKVPL